MSPYYKRKKKPQEDWPDHEERKWKLDPKIREKLMPLYERLSSEQLLQCCQQGKTTNHNEAFHSLVWMQVPKRVFVGRKKFEIGAQKAASK